MADLLALLDSVEMSPPLPGDEAAAAAATLDALGGGSVYPSSIVAQNGALYFLANLAGERRLGILARAGHLPAGFTGGDERVSLAGQELALRRCLPEHGNAVALRAALPFTAPRLLGLVPSFGSGDRLGLATPGHIRGVRGHACAPIFAQQSIREMIRTRRTPEQVLDDATWGVFQEGWRGGFGADADHLKTAADVDLCTAAGYTFYTIDPGEHVDNDADTDGTAALAAKVEALPWRELESSPRSLRAGYAGRTFSLEAGLSLTFSEEDFLRAAAKYGRAIAHTVGLYRRLVERLGAGAFELEMSVDETATPTSVAAHWFVASELMRLGVRWVSLAPRFSGRFEKGVDYIGDLGAFERELVQHAAVARQFGNYRLSLHSGSDKFSIYPLFARHTGGMMHLKTAGTSYLEALRALARVEPGLFRVVLALARERYLQDRASYHVSAELSRVSDPAGLRDSDLPALLDDFHARQVLHVTFGSVLTACDESGECHLRRAIYGALQQHEAEHYQALEAHMRRHVQAVGW